MPWAMALFGIDDHLLLIIAHSSPFLRLCAGGVALVMGFHQSIVSAWGSLGWWLFQRKGQRTIQYTWLIGGKLLNDLAQWIDNGCDTCVAHTNQRKAFFQGTITCVVKVLPLSPRGIPCIVTDSQNPLGGQSPIRSFDGSRKDAFITNQATKWRGVGPRQGSWLVFAR